MDTKKFRAPGGCRNKKIFIYGYFGAGNIGDELILTAFLTMLDSFGVKFDVIIAVDNLKLYDAARLKSDFINLNILFIQRHKNPLNYEIIKSFIASGAFIIPGGGIFQDYNMLSFLCYYSFLLCSKIFGVKNYLMYQGLTGIKGRAARKLFELAARRLIDYISVRDAGSVRFLSKTRFGGGDCLRHYCDSAFLLKEAISEKIKTARPCAAAVGLSLRPWKGVKPADIAKVLSALVNWSGRKIKLYSMHKGADCAFNAQTAAALDEMTRSNIILVEYSNDVIQLARSLHDNVLNIGMRFHFSVLSMCVGAPCIGLAYDEKVSELYSEANLQQLCLSGREFDETMSGGAAPLLIRAGYALKNSGRIKSAVEIFAESCRKRAVNIFDDFYEKCL